MMTELLVWMNCLFMNELKFVVFFGVVKWEINIYRVKEKYRKLVKGVPHYPLVCNSLSLSRDVVDDEDLKLNANARWKFT